MDTDTDTDYRENIDLTNIECEVCFLKFTKKKNLYAHYRNIHNIEPLIWNPKHEFLCDMCVKSFSCQATLTRHKRKFHHLNHRVRKTRLICPYDSCSEVFLYYDNLNSHLSQNHGVEVECEHLHFDCIEDFETWKEEIQQATYSMYAKDTRGRILKSGVTRIFMNCHRSYCYKKKGINKRALKSMESYKIGKACPSRLEITVNENAEDEPAVSVKYWKTHCGHAQQIERMSVTGLSLEKPCTHIPHSNESESSHGNYLNRDELQLNLFNNMNAITKTERLLSLLNNIELSVEESKLVETEIDKIIKLLNETKEINLNESENLNSNNNEEKIILIITDN